MNFEFGINKNYEVPLITLCSPNRKEIADISNFLNLHIKPQFNAVSEVTFDAFTVRTENYFIVKGDDIPFCWEIKAKRRNFENTRLEEYKEGG